MVRAHIHFRGTVQGVGFRYTTLSFAHQLTLTGWVKNLPDGRVEALIEGSRDKIEELLFKLKGQFGPYIKEQNVDWLMPQGKFDKFSIV